MTPAEVAASRAGIELRTASELAEIEAVDALFTLVWGGGPQNAAPVNTMRALVHAGHYIGTAWRAHELVGAALGFAYLGEASLHSHIAGVSPADQGSGVGYALKLHQAEWCRDRGLTTMTWTFDPLIRRNAWFNLSKLGTTGEKYLVNFYGAMQDGINDGDESDRCLVVWDLVPSPSNPVADPREGPAILAIGRLGQPDVSGLPPGADVLRCQIPDDIVTLRRHDPPAAREWRMALRDTLGAALAEGYAATSFTPDGYYVLERRDR